MGGGGGGGGGTVKEEAHSLDISKLYHIVEFVLTLVAYGSTAYVHALVVDVKTSHLTPRLSVSPLFSLRAKQEQPEGHLTGGCRARGPPTGLAERGAATERRRQRQQNCPPQAHVRGSPRLQRDPRHAAARHGQEEGGVPGASEAEVPPSRLSDHGPPGEAAGAGQSERLGCGMWGSHCLV